jgi:hypothetical protein
VGRIRSHFVTLAQKVEMATTMFRAAERYLMGSSAEDQRHPELTTKHATIYTSLLPLSCVLTWLEFIVYCHEHDDPTLRSEAAKIIAAIVAKLHVLKR